MALRFNRAFARLIPLTAALLLLTGGGPAEAHRTGIAKSLVEVTGEAVAYRLSVSAHDLSVALGFETDLEAPVPQSRFIDDPSILQDYLTSRLRLTSGGQVCAIGLHVVYYPDGADSLEVEIPFDCAKPLERLGIDYLLFFDIDKAHQGLGRVVVWGVGEARFLFDREIRSFEMPIER